jgi:hypothetical protein
MPERVRTGEGRVRIPPERARQVKRLAGVIATEPFHRRSWAELWYFLVSSALALAAVILLAVSGMVGTALSVVFLGVVILAGGLPAARGFGAW